MGNDGRLNTGEFSKLTTIMFSAAMGQVGWDRFLEALSVQAGDICTHIIGFDSEANIALGLEPYGYDPAYLKVYDEHYAELNSWAPGFMEKPVGVTVDCEDMCRTEELIKTEFYADWVQPQENITQGGGALLFKNDTRLFALGGNIRLKDAEKLKAPWLQMVDQLIPHMQQAFEISRALAGSKLESTLIASNRLSEVPGFVVLSEQGRILFANQAAQTMIERGQPIACDLRGKLICSTQSHAMQSAHEIMSHQLLSSAQSFTIASQSDDYDTVYNLRFAKMTPDAGIPMDIGPSLGFSQHCTLLLIVPKRSANDVLAEFRSIYGLTDAELSLVRLLADGLTNPQIADEKLRATSTINTQVKSILAKTNCSTRTQFAKLVLKNEANFSR